MAPPEYRPNSDIDLSKEFVLPDMDRKYVLLFLLDSCGSLTKSELDTMALTIRGSQQPQGSNTGVPTTPEGFVTPAADHATAPRAEHTATLADLRKAIGENSVEDEVFDHIVLSYSSDELRDRGDQIFQPTPDKSRSPVDTWAGGDASRMPLKELYSLESLGNVVVRGDRYTEDISFFPSRSGHELAKALGIIFRSIDWHNFVVISERNQLRTSTLSDFGALAKPQT